LIRDGVSLGEENWLVDNLGRVMGSLRYFDETLEWMETRLM